MKILLASLFIISFALAKAETSKSKAPIEGCNSTQGWGYFCKFNVEFEKKQNITVMGTIGSLEPISVAPKMSDGVALKIKVNGSDQIMEVLLGPEWFIKYWDEVLKPGDEIVVNGIEGFFEGKKWILTQSLTRGDRRIELINRDGHLAWSPWSPVKKEIPNNKTKTKNIIKK